MFKTMQINIGNRYTGTIVEAPYFNHPQIRTESQKEYIQIGNESATTTALARGNPNFTLISFFISGTEDMSSYESYLPMILTAELTKGRIEKLQNAAGAFVGKNLTVEEQINLGKKSIIFQDKSFVESIPYDLPIMQGNAIDTAWNDISFIPYLLQITKDWTRTVNYDEQKQEQ